MSDTGEWEEKTDESGERSGRWIGCSYAVIIGPSINYNIDLYSAIICVDMCVFWSQQEDKRAKFISLFDI